MKTTQVLIGICNGKLEQLKPAAYNRNEIRVDIGTLDEKDGKPRNFLADSDTPRNSTGGCFARIFASEYGEGTGANLFNHYGPACTWAHLEEYEHAVRALKRIQAAHKEFYATRGNAVDAAEEMGRFLEACGVKRVFMRPDDETNTGWMNKGEWLDLSVGDFVSRVRRNLYVAPMKQELATA